MSNGASIATLQRKMTLYAGPKITPFIIPCSQNWRQLEQDLWRLETWLSHARASLRNQRSVPGSMEQLEDAIQDHREFLMDLDGHKSLLLSINVVGAHLAESSSDEARSAALQRRLAEVNEAWDAVCEEAAHWQTKLQTALLEVRIGSKPRAVLKL